ncbi:hypothetical protein [uncultured Abyssibacter sp.]|uniref:hypothetical protein n=1 Tax=uncultured Abyssibacter sp. TaxID=2320202 RepID=UPI0032B2D754
MNTQFSAWLRAIVLALISVSIIACGSDNTLSGDNDDSGDGTGGVDDPTDPVNEIVLRMGTLDGNTGTFTQNVIFVEDSPIADGVGTALRVDIVDENGTPYTDEAITVAFTANCADASALPTNRSTGTSGSASTVYTGTVACAGQDAVTATASFGDQTLTATSNVEVRVVRMGVLDAGTFTEGAIAVGQSPIATRGSSGLRVDFVDQNDDLVTSSTLSVAFSSAVCGNDASLDSPVNSVNGTARSTFQDAGCASGSEITDTISASTTAFGKTLSATGSLTVRPANLGALEFVQANPPVIGLRGTGGQGIQETSTVTFLLRDDVGDPVEGETVTFSLDRNTGGIELSDTQGITNSDGQVSVVVRAGTVHTSVRVRAEATDGNSGETISSQSDQLVISSGIVDNDSFSLTAECFNLEAFDYDGVETQVNIRLADRFNNPVPEGTAVAFTTEEGSIDGQCFVDATGACSVTWRSQGRRPEDGRTTVLATATGEESFFDSNGDGVHQDGEQNLAIQDLPEAFLDRDEDGTYDALGFGTNGRQTPNRPFTSIEADSNVDFNNDNLHNPASGSFTGLLCESGCDDPTEGTLLSVRESLVLIFSGSTAHVDGQFIADGDGFNDSLLVLDQTGTDPSPTGVALTSNSADFDGTMNLGQQFDNNGDPTSFIGGASIGVILRDERGQPLPVGTTVVIDTDIGSPAGIASYEVLCTTSDSLLSHLYVFSIDGPDPDAEADQGSIRITATTPRGIFRQLSYGVTFTPAPDGP